MTELPPIIKLCIETNRIDVALQWADTLTERLQVAEYGNRERMAQDIASDALWGQTVDSVRVEGDTVTVQAGPFSGVHGIRDSRHDSSPSPTSIGSYIHEPSDTEFEAECPEPLKLEDKVREASVSEGPGEAARAEYRSSRL